MSTRRRMMPQGGGQQGGLPAGYSPCDYIRVSADYDTGLKPHENMSAKMKVRMPSGSKWTGTRYIGCYISSVNNDNWGIVAYSGTTSVMNGDPNAGARETGGLGMISEIEAIFASDFTYLSVSNNGGIPKVASVVPSTRPNFNKNIEIRAVGNPVDYWYVTIYGDRNYGVPVLNYVPCVEDATGDAGFWDEVSQSFKHNGGMSAGYDL